MEAYNCNNREELTAKEGQYIRELNPALNTRIEGRTKIQYYGDNKYTYTERAKQYRRANKDKVTEQKHKYYVNNKDKMQERNKNYYENNKCKFKHYYEQKKQEKTNTV